MLWKLKRNIKTAHLLELVKRGKKQIARQVIIGIYKKEKEHMRCTSQKKSEVSGEQYKCWKKKIKN